MSVLLLLFMGYFKFVVWLVFLVSMNNFIIKSSLIEMKIQHVPNKQVENTN